MSIQVKTLEEVGLTNLIEAVKNTEAAFGQFEISQARVKRLAKELYDSDMGDYRMHTPIRIGYTRYNDDGGYNEHHIPYVIGGRHRIEAMKLIVETKHELDDSLDSINGYVLVEEVDTLARLGEMIACDNGSRSVNKAEKALLTYTNKPYANYEEPIGNITELKAMGHVHYKLNSQNQTEKTLQAIWGRVISELNKVCKKEIQSLVNGSYETQLQFAEIFQECYDEVVADLKGCARKHCPVADNIVNLIQDKLDFIPIITKKDSGVDNSTHEWIHSDKVAEACLPTDVTSIKERLAKKEEETKVNEEDFSCF